MEAFLNDTTFLWWSVPPDSEGIGYGEFKVKANRRGWG